MEQDSFVWVFIGDPGRADAVPVPRAPWLEQPGWTTVSGMEPLAARASLLVDNLMDLTHETYVHASTIGQREIDESIARHSESEVLYDQPYEDSKRVRVAGPFTVESLSPHRTLDPEQQPQPAAEREAQADPAQPGWEAMVIEHLRSAGIQNTKRGERLKFLRLERHANPWLHAVGEWEQAASRARTALSGGAAMLALGWASMAAAQDATPQAGAEAGPVTVDTSQGDIVVTDERAGAAAPQPPRCPRRFG